MVLSLLFFFLGYLEVRVTGRHLERFLNLAVYRGIYFWNVRRREDALHLHMGVRAFCSLRPVARKARCRVRIVRRRGLPFLLRRARGRAVLLGGAAVVAALLYAASSFVWVVEVRGLRTVPEATVLRALSDLGLRPGVPKGAVHLRRVVNDLPLRVPGLAWASVRLEGTKAVVQVVERTVLAQDERPETAPGDVVAAKDGLITHLLVLAGEPAVREGELVRRGQVLIRGVLTPGGGEEPPAAGAPGPVRVRARGIVQARVWYNMYAEAPLVQQAAVRTGAVYVRRLVRLAGREVVLSGRRGPPFADWQVEEVHLWPLRWRNATLPVEFVNLRYYQVRQQTRRVTRGEALAQAEAEARRRLLAQIPKGARVERENAQVVQDEGGVVGLRLTIETEEDIGRWAAPGTGAAGVSGSGREGRRRQDLVR